MKTLKVEMEIRNVERWKDRHGKRRLYYRVGKGPRTPLRGPIGSPEFWEDYKRATKNEKPATKDSVRWLVTQYYSSAAFRQMSLRSQTVRRGILERFCGRHGSKRYSKLERRHLREIRDSMVDRPEAANALVKALRQVFKFAVE